VYDRELVPPSDDAKVLFIGGLPVHDNVVAIDITTASHYGPSSADETDTANSSDSNSDRGPITIESSLTALLESLVRGVQVISVTKVKGKSYAFAEFDSHLSAMALVTKSIKTSVELGERPLTIGWASVKHFADTSHEEKAPLLLAPPSINAKVLFLRNVPPATTGDVPHTQ
jgi:hypothetical protein